MKRHGLLMTAIACLLLAHTALAQEPAGRGGAGGGRAQGGGGRIDWNARAPWGVQPNAPFDKQGKDPVKLFDNVWDVGLQTVTPYLIVTSAGLVLFDSTWAETADMVLGNVRKAGFDPKNIKYIILTHAHIDHIGGANKMKEQIPGVRSAMSARDWEAADDLMGKPGRGGTIPGLIAHDMILADGQMLTLGDTTFKFYVTPGHTPGSTSVEYRAKDRGKTYRVLHPGGLGMPSAEWTEPYIKSTERYKALGPWDVMLPNHPDMMLPHRLAQVEMELATRGNGPHPGVVGSAAINEWLDAVLKVAREKLATEQKAAAN